VVIVAGSWPKILTAEYRRDDQRAFAALMLLEHDYGVVISAERHP
jgi:hypothetical protein